MKGIRYSNNTIQNHFSIVKRLIIVLLVTLVVYLSPTYRILHKFQQGTRGYNFTVETSVCCAALREGEN